jgi:O-methyltransferase
MIEAVKSLLRRVRTRLCETDPEFIRLRSELATLLDNRNDPSNEFAALAIVNSPLRGRVYADFSELEKSVYRRSISVASAEAIVSLMRALEYLVDKRIPGAFVECGVFKGGNIEVMIKTLQHLKVDDRDIYLYDTFAGMPQPDSLDDDGLDGQPLRLSWETHRTDVDGTAGSNWMRASIEVVKRRIDRLRYPEQRLHYVKGMVEETIPKTMPEKIALLRLDTDFYSSTKHELNYLYPRLASGGILIIDDYGSIPGARLAVDEYATENRVNWFMNRVDAHVRLIVKP